MSRTPCELEVLLSQLIAEHRRLLKSVENQQRAMKVLDLKGMDEAARNAEATRLRIATLDNRRRLLVGQMAKAMRLVGPVTVTRLAEAMADRREALLTLRDELKGAIEDVQKRTFIAGKLAGAVLGHLNTVVRLLAGAVERAGLYTKHGIPQV